MAEAAGSSILHTTILPAALLIVTPPITGLIWYTDTRLDGSITRLAEWIGSAGIVAVLAQALGPVALGSPAAWAIIAVFAALELLLMRALPGPMSDGPVTPMGEIPHYKANGVAAFAVTILLFLLFSLGFGVFRQRSSLTTSANSSAR